MSNRRQQSTTTYPLAFFMALSIDHLTGATGKTVTVTLSKNGAAFGAASGAVTEIGNGWYSIANATDFNTLGQLLIHATATGCDPFDGTLEIVAYDPFDNTYQAKVWMSDDDNGTNDRYTARWFKNGQPITSSVTTSIQVIKVSDGTDLVASTSMTHVTNGLYRYNEATNRISDGAAYEIKISATIDGAPRTWFQPVSRDS